MRIDLIWSQDRLSLGERCGYEQGHRKGGEQLGAGRIASQARRHGLRELPSERKPQDRLSRAAHRNQRFSKKGLRERLFTLAFRGLVYPQIWEDPVVDLEALRAESAAGKSPRGDGRPMELPI